MVELTVEGDDRVFFVVTDVRTMAEEDQAAAAYLESYEVLAFRYGLTPG
jgi:hypothetical protein